MANGDEMVIEAVDPIVARALRAMSGMERLRLGLETWELTRDRLAAYSPPGIPRGLPRRSDARSR